MWIVEVSLRDTPERLAARPAHRARLAMLHERGIVPAAGPFADGTGAIMVFDVERRETLDELLAGDAYLTKPGVGFVSIREFTSVVG
jgi:uncharacterized protein YciI